jgi:hypothetical protein
MGRSVMAVLYAVLALGGVTLAAAAVDPLSEGLESVCLAYRHAQEAAVGYVPCGIRWVDAAHQPVSGPEVIPVGPQHMMLSGRLSFMAEPTEVQTLEQRATALFGREPAVVEVRPQAFELWLAVGGQVVWTRPLAAGSVRAIPVQIMVEKPAVGSRMDATLMGVMTWTEMIDRFEATLSINWQALVEHVAAESQVSGVLREAQIRALAEHALAAGWVRVERAPEAGISDMDAMASSNQLSEILAAHITRLLLVRVVPRVPDTPAGVQEERATASPGTASTPRAAPAAGPELWAVSYRLREGVRTESLGATLDLRVVTHLERTTTVQRVLPLR